MDDGHHFELLEKLATYGNPKTYAMPVVNDKDSANMSFAGLQSEILKFVNGRVEHLELTFESICDHLAAM